MRFDDVLFCVLSVVWFCVFFKLQLLIAFSFRVNV